VQERLGTAPTLQYRGPGLRELKLRGTIYPHFRGGLDQVDRLIEMAGEGEAKRLTDGRGRILGKWALVRIENVLRVFLPGGIPRRIEFDLTFQFYGEYRYQPWQEELEPEI
jgi:phage protein U